MPVYAIEGMTCDHCARAVKEAVGRADPGAAVEVDLPGGRMTVSGAAAPAGGIEAAVAEEGYTARLLG